MGSKVRGCMQQERGRSKAAEPPSHCPCFPHAPASSASVGARPRSRCSRVEVSKSSSSRLSTGPSSVFSIPTTCSANSRPAGRTPTPSPLEPAPADSDASEVSSSLTSPSPPEAHLASLPSAAPCSSPILNFPPLLTLRFPAGASAPPPPFRSPPSPSPTLPRPAAPPPPVDCRPPSPTTPRTASDRCASSPACGNTGGGGLTGGGGGSIRWSGPIPAKGILDRETFYTAGGGTDTLPCGSLSSNGPMRSVPSSGRTKNGTPCSSSSARRAAISPDRKSVV